jgi:hypothetical protein
MPDSVYLVPRRLIAEVVGTLPLRVALPFSPEAMAVDAEGNAWVDQLAAPLALDHAAWVAVEKTEPYIWIEKTDDGIIVGLKGARDYRWLPTTKPERKRGYQWLQVAKAFP